MNKKLLKVIMVSLVLIVIAYGAYFKLSSANPYNDHKNIGITELLEQKEHDYYVYFYMKDCYYCNFIKEDLFNFANNNDNFYFIDLTKVNGNERLVYDWEKFNTENDIEIGISKDDKTIDYYNGENEEKYINSNVKNKFGKKKQFEITIADSEYLKTNKNAELGKVYAKEIIPEIDYGKYKKGEKLMLGGAPTLLHINQGTIENYWFDSRDISDFLKEVTLK